MDTVDAAEPGFQSMSIKNDTGQHPTFLEGPLEMADGASLASLAMSRVYTRH